MSLANFRNCWFQIRVCLKRYVWANVFTEKLQFSKQNTKISFLHKVTNTTKIYFLQIVLANPHQRHDYAGYIHSSTIAPESPSDFVAEKKIIYFADRSEVKNKTYIFCKLIRSWSIPFDLFRPNDVGLKSLGHIFTLITRWSVEAKKLQTTSNKHKPSPTAGEVVWQRKKLISGKQHRVCSSAKHTEHKLAGIVQNDWKGLVKARDYIKLEKEKEITKKCKTFLHLSNV